MNPSQVLPRLFVGSCPANSDDIDRLKTDHGITAILSLQTDDELGQIRIEAHCDELGIRVQRIPVQAFAGEEDGPGQLSQCVAALDKLLRGGHVVYAHCNLARSVRPAWWSPIWHGDRAGTWTMPSHMCKHATRALPT